MSGRMESTAELVLEKYDGDLENLREMAGRDAKEEMKLIKEFKGVGDTAVNIFCREVQLLWEELFPFADQRTLETLAHHGIICNSAQEVADLVDNDRQAALLACALLLPFALLFGLIGAVSLHGKSNT